MRRSVVAVGLAVLLGVGSLALLAFSAVADDADSAFAQGGGTGLFVAQSQALGLPTRRLAAGPLGLPADLDAPRTLLVVLSPPRPYTVEEQVRTTKFLEQGGRILVADNFHEANSLTAPWGILFQRVRLVEENRSAIAHSLAGHAYPLPLGQPTALHLADGLAPAVVTSDASFLDLDGNGLIDAADPRGPFPLVAEVPVGQGLAVAVGDPWLLAPPDGNPGAAAWRQALLEHLLPEGGTLLVDESRIATDDPLVSGLGAVVGASGSRWGAVVLGGLSLLLFVAAAVPRLRQLWQPHRFRPDHFVRRAAPVASEGSAVAPPDDEWTGRGVVALLGGPGLALAALVLGNREAAWGAAFLGVFAAAALLPGRPRVQAERRLAEVRVNEETVVPVRLHLQPRRGACEVEARDALPSEFDLVQGSNWMSLRLPRGGQDWSYAVKPALRGPYPVGPLVLRRMDPLGLHAYTREAAPAATLEVLPRKEPLNRTPFKTRIPSVTLGPHLVNRAGDGSEFHSLREYQEGDSFRAINWRASARSTQLVVSQRVHESMTTLTLFLDARAASGAGPANRTPLADGCRAALSLAAGALQVRDRVRILVYGNGVTELPPGRGARQIHELTDLLATLDAGGDTPFSDAVTTALPNLRSGNPAILLSGLEADPTIPEAMRQLRSRGLLCLTVASPIATRPVHDDEGAPEKDAAAIQAQREATLQALRAAGIPTFETKPGVPLDHLFRLGGSA